MSKELCEMTLEELWKLFPITLVPPLDTWDKQYLAEEKKLRFFLPFQKEIKINHIGSTTIKGILAKPIVDILIEIPIYLNLDLFEEPLVNHGWLCMAKNSFRMDFNKGYTKDGFSSNVFHLHMRLMGDHDELYFRDYLNEHFSIAKEYEKLKLSLSSEFKYNRDKYTQGKSDFVKKITDLAKKEYRLKYK